MHALSQTFSVQVVNLAHTHSEGCVFQASRKAKYSNKRRTITQHLFNRNYAPKSRSRSFVRKCRHVTLHNIPITTARLGSLNMRVELQLHEKNSRLNVCVVEKKSNQDDQIMCVTLLSFRFEQFYHYRMRGADGWLLKE
jgi:hypothetical protein